MSQTFLVTEGEVKYRLQILDDGSVRGAERLPADLLVALRRTIAKSGRVAMSTGAGRRHFAWERLE